MKEVEDIIDLYFVNGGFKLSFMESGAAKSRSFMKTYAMSSSGVKYFEHKTNIDPNDVFQFLCGREINGKTLSNGDIVERVSVNHKGIDTEVMVLITEGGLFVDVFRLTGDDLVNLEYSSLDKWNDLLSSKSKGLFLLMAKHDSSFYDISSIADQSSPSGVQLFSETDDIQEMIASSKEKASLYAANLVGDIVDSYTLMYKPKCLDMPFIFDVEAIYYGMEFISVCEDRVERHLIGEVVEFSSKEDVMRFINDESEIIGRIMAKAKNLQEVGTARE